MASTASPPLAWAASISLSCASVRLSESILVIPRSSPPTSDLKPAPICEPTWRDRTVMPNTSPSTSVTSYPGRSFIVERIIAVPFRRPSRPRVMPGSQTYPGTVVLAPEGRRMLRIEARNSQVPVERKPPWIKTRLRTGPEYTALKDLVRRQGLHTGCGEAGCPNIFECWGDREATFLIGGDACTRRCDFCQIATGKPEPLDTDEPRRVAASVAAMGLRYATVTGVARDDLPDGGAWLYAQTCREIHQAIPGCGVELLIPDFNADPDQLAEVFSARPEVLAHN